MKKIETVFTKKGFKYTQVVRKGDKAIFTQERAEKGSVMKNYEVVLIKKHNGYEIGGSVIPPSEVYPSSTQWGALGWTFQSIEDARKKYDTL
jgi:hypothetical protein